MSINRSCFIIMPFRPELNYFYLYVKKHIQDKHGIECYRGDNDVLTIPLLEKIKKYIEESNVIIADCSGRNPNVFYELGIAHTLNKKVILITMDEIREAPSDIRHYEFIKYQLDKHEEFIERLDNALGNVFVEDYKALYENAIKIFNDFKKESGLQVQPLNREVFISKMMKLESTQAIPQVENDFKTRQFLLPKIIDFREEFIIMEKVTKWLIDD